MVSRLALREGSLSVCRNPAGRGTAEIKITRSGGSRSRETGPTKTLPPHVSFAFFPVRDPVQNTRQISANGEVYVTPWDWRFDDNAGFLQGVSCRSARAYCRPPAQFLIV
jgi:hypothetical protein